jgi:hypothetical protein
MDLPRFRGQFLVFAVPKLAALADANDAEFFDHLAPKDRASLLRILREIVEKRGLKSLPVD